MSEDHESLALQIAAEDLRYASGSALSASQRGRGTHPKLWGFVQWGVMVAFEGRKRLSDAHSRQLSLAWDDQIAAAARHSGKFFDDRWLLLEGVLARFNALIEANHSAYFPPNRPMPMLDYLRRDLSVMIQDDEVVLTNVSGFFMMGMPPEIAADLEAGGPLGYTLAQGIGEAAAAFTGEDLTEIRPHGNHEFSHVTWSDAKASDLLASTFGGALDQSLAMALITLQASIQSARRWGNATCCIACVRASRKHRFVVLYQALRSIELLQGSGTDLGPNGRDRIADILDPNAEAATILSPPFRRLRNGWLHLGTSDIADRLPPDAVSSDLVAAYTELDLQSFDLLIESGLARYVAISNQWMLEADRQGKTLFDHLHEPS